MIQVEKSINELYQAAVAFKKLKAWSFMLEDQVFGIAHPKTGEMTYCSITGHLGQDVGITVYLNDASFEHVYKVMCDAEHMPTPILADHLLSVTALKCSFESKEHLLPEEQDRLKALGLRFRGENAWPACRRLTLGRVPEMLEDEEESLFLTYVLTEATRLMTQVKKGEVTIEPIQLGCKIPCIVPSDIEENASQLVYKDLKLQPQVTSIPYIYKDELKIKKVLGLKTKSLTLECATVLLPMPVGPEGTKGLPTIMVAMNPRDGQIFFADVVTAEVSKSIEGQRAILLDQFIEAMLNNHIKPRYILINKEEDRLLLEDFCKKARIDLKEQNYSYDFCEVLEEVSSSLMMPSYFSGFDEDEDYNLEDLEDDVDDYFSEEIKDFIELTIHHMLASSIAQNYSEDEKEELGGTIEMFVQVAYDIYDTLPNEWNKRLIEAMFKEAIPYYVTIPYDELVKVPSRLRDYFAFLGKEELLNNTQELIQATKKNEAILLKNGKDESKWNEAKKARMKALN